MRSLIISDIHGSPTHLEQVLSQYERDSLDAIVLLGDILYHGPRNAIPKDYHPQKVVTLLNSYKDRIIACRGNCEAEVDQMLLDFPCMSDYCLFFDNNWRFFATHGHLYTSDNFPTRSLTHVFLSGHTHLWLLKQIGPLICCNPGSITLPKEGRPATYALYDSGTLSILDLNGHVLSTLTL